MKILLVLPIIIPLTTAAFCLLLNPWKAARRFANFAGATGHLASGILLFQWVLREGIQAVQIGNWPAPFGITIVADLFSAIMILITGFMGLMVCIYSYGDIDPSRETHGYYPLFHILLMGVSGAFLTGDLFNLYVWFEVMLMASFALMALGSEKKQIEGSIKYVIINLVSSLLFLSGIGILYGITGSLNMADLALKLNGQVPANLVTTVAMLFLFSFGIKAAIFPFFFWLPASYHTPPVAVSAIFAALLTKVGVYALIRVFTLLFVVEVGFTHGFILVLSGLTMIVGVLGAIAQMEFRRLLSFHIVSQIGYMIMGLGLFTEIGLAASIFYIIHHIIV